MRRLLTNRSGRRLVLASLTSVLLLGLVACYPGGPENVDELNLVLTFKTPGVSFAGIKTYGLEDRVAALGTPNGTLDSIFDDTILNSLNENMVARGFTRVDHTVEKPDVWLAVGGVQTTVWFEWYSWGGGGYYPPYGGYYPSYGGVGSFEQGSVVWQMLDLREVTEWPITSPEVQPIALWVAGINGAMVGSDAETHTGIRKGFGVAFDQSPYVIAEPPTKRTGQEVE